MNSRAYRTAEEWILNPSELKQQYIHEHMRDSFLAGVRWAVEEGKKKKREQVTHIRIIQNGIEYLKDYDECVLLEDLEALAQEIAEQFEKMEDGK